MRNHNGGTIPWSMSEMTPYEIVSGIKDRTPEQQDAADRSARLDRRRWKRCSDCHQYLMEEPLSFAPCPCPENHGPDYVWNNETRRLELRPDRAEELRGFGLVAEEVEPEPELTGVSK